MWNALTYHAPVWLCFFTLGWYLSGGTIQPPEEAQPIVAEIVETDLSWERCGQYDLGYQLEPNGFYNCINKGS